MTRLDTFRNVEGVVVLIGVLYVAMLLGFTLAFTSGVPTLGWIGFGIVVAVVTVLASLAISALRHDAHLR